MPVLSIIAEFLQKQKERLVKDLAASEQTSIRLERENKHLLEQLREARQLELKRKRIKRSESNLQQPGSVAARLEEMMSRRRE